MSYYKRTSRRVFQRHDRDTCDYSLLAPWHKEVKIRDKRSTIGHICLVTICQRHEVREISESFNHEVRAFPHNAPYADCLKSGKSYQSDSSGFFHHVSSLRLFPYHLFHYRQKNTVAYAVVLAIILLQGEDSRNHSHTEIAVVVSTEMHYKEIQQIMELGFHLSMT